MKSVKASRQSSGVMPAMHFVPSGCIQNLSCQPAVTAGIFGSVCTCAEEVWQGQHGQTDGHEHGGETHVGLPADG
jgi:hypothetical protein